MIVYLLKFVACSGVLLLFYHFVLQNDRLFKFNRFFLLAIVGLALLIPITTVRTNYIEIPTVQAATFDTPVNTINQSPQTLPYTEYIPEVVQAPFLSTERVLVGSYVMITLLLLIRFGSNLYAINRLRKNTHIVEHSDIKIVLRSDISTSFSFLNYMFTNKERYEQGNLPEEIIQHEKLHIKQYHSLDIIFIELLQCFFWFNPFVYFIRKAVKLNHEFLADAFVIGENISAHNYQKILLDFTGKQLLKSPLLASNLNYGFTKKRLNMMVKNTNTWRALFKQVSALVIITVTFFMLGITETVAQEVERKQIQFTTRFELPIIDKSKSSNPNDTTRKASLPHIPSLDNPLMRYELDGRMVEVNMDDFTYEERVKVIEEGVKLEYQNKTTSKWNTIGISFKPEQDKKEATIKKPEIELTKRDTTKRPKYIRIGAQKTSRVRFTMEDGRKVEKLLKELSPEEYERFRAPESEPEFFLPPKAKMNVDQATFNEFFNEEVYGIWIDGKKVDSNELNKYSPSDIHHYTKSKLYRGAKKDKGYTHQLDITTNEHFNNGPNVNGKWFFSSPTDFSNYQVQKSKVKQDNRPSPPFKLNLVRFKNTAGELVTKKFSELSESEKKRFKTRASNPEYYVPERPKIIMNQSMLDDFGNTDKYRVILNGKIINNDLLKNYDPKDIHDFRKEKPSNDSWKHEFWVYLTTDQHFKSLPAFKTGWLTYPSMPQIIEVKNDKEKKEKNKGTKEKPQIIEVKSIKEKKLVEKPQIKEVKSVREKEIKEKPQVIEVKSVSERKLKEKPQTKEKSKNQKQDENDKFKDGTVTQKLLDEVGNNNRYWLSIDGQFVENNVLKNYKPEDFYDYFKAGIDEKSKQASTYDFEIDLVTITAYNVEKELSEKNMAILSNDILLLNDKPEGMKFNLMNKKTGFQQVRFIDHGGKLIEGRFTSFPRKQKQRFYWHESYGQFFVNYSDLTPPKMNEVAKLVEDKYTLRIDGKIVNYEILSEFNQDSFSHAFQYVLYSRENRDERIKEIDFITKTNPLLRKSPEGLWVSL